MSSPSSPTMSVSSLSSDVSIRSLTPQPEIVEHDDYFYFHNVVFKAGNMLFKVVPQYSLPIEDQGFAALLKPVPGEKQQRGLTDNHPIVLPADVTPEDFRSLLKACNPKPNARNPALTLDTWMSVLKLAKMWSLDSLRPKAIAEAESLFKTQSPIEKVLLGKKYMVSKWLIEGYEALGRQDGMISDEERAKLGIDTYIGLIKLREMAAAHALRDAVTTIGSVYNRTHSYNATMCTPSSFRNKFNFSMAINDIFATELKQDKEYAA